MHDGNHQKSSFASEVSELGSRTIPFYRSPKGQGARGDLNSTIIKNFRLPVPYANDPAKSLAEQARIVAILDKFDTLTTSLQKGLPREIELRQKQYEYYRDMLLSFPKLEEVAA